MKLVRFLLLVSAVVALMASGAVAGTFPPAGTDNYASTHMRFKVELLAYPGNWMLGDLWGPISVGRGDPYPYTLLGGDQAIDTEMLMMNMTGQIGGMPAHLGESATLASPGMIIDTDPDPADSFPAFSFFDIFFEVTVYTPDPWILHNKDPFRVVSEIDSIPPNLYENPYGAGDDFVFWYLGDMFRGGWIPIAEWEALGYDPDDMDYWRAHAPFATLQTTPVALYDSGDNHVANLDTASACHEPEPATLALLAIGSLLLIRRRS